MSRSSFGRFVASFVLASIASFILASIRYLIQPVVPDTTSFLMMHRKERWCGSIWGSADAGALSCSDNRCGSFQFLTENCIGLSDRCSFCPDAKFLRLEPRCRRLSNHARSQDRIACDPAECYKSECSSHRGRIVIKD